MNHQEFLQASVDTALLELLAKRGPHSSERLVLGTAATALPLGHPVWDDRGETTDLGDATLRRWDQLRKEWG